MATIAATRARHRLPNSATAPLAEPTARKNPPRTHPTHPLSAPVTRTRGSAASTRSVAHGRPTAQPIHTNSIVTKAMVNATPAATDNHAPSRRLRARRRSAPQNASERTAAGRARIGVSV